MKSSVERLLSDVRALNKQAEDFDVNVVANHRAMQKKLTEKKKIVKKESELTQNLNGSARARKRDGRVNSKEKRNASAVLPVKANQLCKRPVNSKGDGKPVSAGRDHRYRGKNTSSMKLRSCTQVSGEYQGPAVAPKTEAILDDVRKDEGATDGAPSLRSGRISKSRLYRKNYGKDKLLN